MQFQCSVCPIFWFLDLSNFWYERLFSCSGLLHPQFWSNTCIWATTALAFELLATTHPVHWFRSWGHELFLVYRRFVLVARNSHTACGNPRKLLLWWRDFTRPSQETSGSLPIQSAFLFRNPNDFEEFLTPWLRSLLSQCRIWTQRRGRASFSNSRTFTGIEESKQIRIHSLEESKKNR
jgi:hypothetical protein